MWTWFRRTHEPEFNFTSLLNSLTGHGDTQTLLATTTLGAFHGSGEITMIDDASLPMRNLKDFQGFLRHTKALKTFSGN